MERHYRLWDYYEELNEELELLESQQPVRRYTHVSLMPVQNRFQYGRVEMRIPSIYRNQVQGTQIVQEPSLNVQGRNHVQQSMYQDYMSVRNIFNMSPTDLMEMTSTMNPFMNLVLEQMIPLLQEGELEDVKITISQEDFDKLKHYQYDKDVHVSNECYICMDAYEQGCELVEIPCNHYFHKDCIQKWLTTEKVTCPVCRKDVRST